MHHEETEIKKALKHFGISELETNFVKFLRDNKPNIGERQIMFSNSLHPFLEEHGRDMLRDFYLHFAEPNKTNTKLKFELEKTWNLSMRLKKWKRNNFNKPKKPNNETQSVESFWRK